MTRPGPVGDGRQLRRRVVTAVAIVSTGAVSVGCDGSGSGSAPAQASKAPPGETAGPGYLTTTPPTSTAAGLHDPPPGRSYLRNEAAYRSTSELPRVTGPAHSTSAVSVFALSASTESQLTADFDQYEAVGNTCHSQTIPGTVHLATIKATGVSFAVAGFRPAPGCYERVDGGTIPGGELGPFGDVPPPPAGLFERQKGHRWVMNVETGKPFPCPPYPDAQGPGAGSPVIPPEVLVAWRMPYYFPGCITATPHPPA